MPGHDESPEPAPSHRAVLTPDLLDAVRETWALAPAGAPTDLGGTYTLTVRLPTAGGDVVVRVHRPWVDAARLATVREVRAALRGAGLPVTVPTPTRAGDDALRFGDRWVEVEPWVPDAGGTDHPARAVVAATMLARMHSALSGLTLDPFVPAPVSNDLAPSRFADWLDRTAAAISAAPPSTERAIATDAVKRVRDLAERARPLADRGRRRLIHGDYGHGNVRFNQDDRVTTIVDLDFLDHGRRVVDLAHLAFGPHWMPGSPELDRPPAGRDWAAVADLIRAHDTATDDPLSHDEIRALPAAMAMVPLTWVASSWLQDDPVAAVALVAPELPVAAWLVGHGAALADGWMSVAGRRP